MPQQLEDILLHKLTHHTNLSVPYSDYISVDKFPKQDLSKLNTIRELKFRNYYRIDPEEDQLTNESKAEMHDIYTAKFLIVRCDIEEPYKLIGISEDYYHIIVQDSRHTDSDVVSIYPHQMSEYIGLKTSSQYPANFNHLDGVTLRVDNTEPCLSVIAEFIDEETVRFVLGDESFFKITGYYYKNSKALNELNDFKSLEDIALLRKFIMKGKKIYGTN